MRCLLCGVAEEVKKAKAVATRPHFLPYELQHRFLVLERQHKRTTLCAASPPIYLWLFWVQQRAKKRQPACLAK